MTFTYDPKEVAVIVGLNRIQGFSEGAIVEVERDEDAFSKQVGGDGQVTRTKSNNTAGKITIPLHQSSSSNDILSALALSGQAVPVQIVDGSGRTVISTRAAWVLKLPVVSFETEGTEREWVLDCGPLTIFVGGNNPATNNA